jgi:hypothetical protein
MSMLTDHLSPLLGTDGEMLMKVEQSTVSLVDLIEGQVCPKQIERAFSSDGCGAVLIKLDGSLSAMYERFYHLQWQLGTRAFDNNLDKENAAAEFAGLDLPVQTLLCRCGVGVARSRNGLTNVMPRSLVETKKLLRNNGFTSAIGRPLARNRKEFHPSVDWLLEQERAGSLCSDETPSYEIVSSSCDYEGSRLMGRSRADEVRLLALYREWKSASPEEQRGHGNKYNGDIYYGAFRGRTHLDCGCSSCAMTVLFGPGELRDCRGLPVPATSTPQELGGNLMVASPEEDTFTSLPYRLPCGSPYVIVFFELEQHHEMLPTPPIPTRRGSVFDTNALGWAATVHGVRRIEDKRFSRGQAVVHVLMTQSDLA